MHYNKMAYSEGNNLPGRVIGNSLKNRKLHIVARHPQSLKIVDLYYVSIKQAKKFNPSLIEFREVGYEF